MTLPGWQIVTVIKARAISGAAALICAATVFAQVTVLEVIPLRYRQAAELIPIIQPLLARDGSVSGFQGQLVVRTTPANQDADVARTRSSAEVSGSVGGDHGRVSIPGSGDTRGGNVVLREGDDQVRVNVLEGSGSERDRSEQTVRVVEGREAFVSIGQSVPVRERQVQRTVVGGRVVEQVVEGAQYRDVASGFYVLPRISGDRVTLDVSSQRESFSRRPAGTVNVQSLVTTVSGRLGEWMEIGGVGQDAAGQQSVLLGRTSTASRDNRRVLIKVEEVR
jgi:type II secretory pathway component GspD/PulD (secretin)